VIIVIMIVSRRVDGLLDSPLDSRNRNYDGALGFHDQHSSAYWRDGSGFTALLCGRFLGMIVNARVGLIHAGRPHHYEVERYGGSKDTEWCPNSGGFGGTVYVGSDAGLISIDPQAG